MKGIRMEDDPLRRAAYAAGVKWDTQMPAPCGNSSPTGDVCWRAMGHLGDHPDLMHEGGCRWANHGAMAGDDFSTAPWIEVRPQPEKEADRPWHDPSLTEGRLE